MSMFFHCVDCWDNPCTCSPERRVGRRWGEMLREQRWRDWCSRHTREEIAAAFASSYQVELEPQDAGEMLHLMQAMGARAGRSLNESVRRILAREPGS